MSHFSTALEPRSGPSTLYLPLAFPVWTWAATAALVAYYVASMARDLSLYDSGELALAAVRLGLAHPPGQPLHTLLGFALSRLPLVPKLIGVGLASALPAALTLIPATSLAQRLMPFASKTSRKLAPVWLALCALHPLLWEPATRVEVYALALFFALWAVARLASVPLDTTTAAAQRQSVSWLFQAGLALGLCASVNPMIALCTGLAVAPGILVRIAHRKLPVSALVAAVVAGMLGLAPYLYVFAVRDRTDVMIWGAPRDAKSLWHYVTLQDYAQNHDLTLALWTSHYLAWFEWAFRHALVWLVVMGVLGHLLLGARTSLGRAAGPLALAFLVGEISYNVVWNLDVPDYSGYLSVGIWLMAAGALAFCAELQRRVRPSIARVALAMTVLLPLTSLPQVWQRTRHVDHLARLLAESVLQQAPRDAIVIARADHFAGSLFYLQEAEAQRPDVVVLAHGLGSSTWHWERIYRMHPGLSAFVLQAPGGRMARIKRFLHAQPARPVLVESFAIAQELGLRACPGGLYFPTGAACDPARAPQLAALHSIARTLETLQDGSPDAAGAIASVTLNVGESLWRMGYTLAAREALLAGVRSAQQPPLSAPAELAGAPALAGSLPTWLRPAPLGDPARNLFLTAQLMASIGRNDLAGAYLRMAASDGLPEALALVSPER